MPRIEDWSRLEVNNTQVTTHALHDAYEEDLVSIQHLVGRI